MYLSHGGGIRVLRSSLDASCVELLSEIILWAHPLLPVNPGGVRCARRARIPHKVGGRGGGRSRGGSPCISPSAVAGEAGCGVGWPRWVSSSLLRTPDRATSFSSSGSFPIFFHYLESHGEVEAVDRGWGWGGHHQSQHAQDTLPLAKSLLSLFSDQRPEKQPAPRPHPPHPPSSPFFSPGGRRLTLCRVWGSGSCWKSVWRGG